MVLVVDQTLVMVSRSQGRVRSWSVWPPQMSTTASPSRTTATEAPTSRPWSRLPANVSRTDPKRSSHVPLISAMAPGPPAPTRPTDTSDAVPPGHDAWSPAHMRAPKRHGGAVGSILDPAYIDPALDCRAATFENPTGQRGAGGKAHGGRKGSP